MFQVFLVFSGFAYLCVLFNPPFVSQGPLVGGILFLSGIVFFVIGFKYLKEKWDIEGIPTSKIRSAAMGPVEILGTAEPSEKLLTPFSGEACVYYAYQIEVYQRQGKNSYWVTIDRGDTSHIPFGLCDETGKILVAPQGAAFSLPISHQFSNTFTSSNAIPERAHEFLKSRNVAETTWLGFEKKLRFTEWAIPVGAMVFALGSATSCEKIAPLESVGNAALSPEPHAESWVLTKGQADYFLISTQSRKDFLTSLGRYALSEVVGGVALAAVGVWLFVSHF